MDSKPTVKHHPRINPTVALVVLGLTLGVVFWLTAQPTALAIVAYVTVGFTIIMTAIDMIRVLRAGHWGLDILAVVAMFATLAVEEYLAGLIIALMLTGGEALEEMAAGRASRELDSLINRRPQHANILSQDGKTLTQVELHQVAVGDMLVVRGSEVVPVDGELVSAHGSLDESSVTGESMPVSKHSGDSIVSGTVNGTEALTMRATTTAADSHYTKIVRLVQEAIDSQAPMVRLADRYAVPFTIIALLIAGIAWWYSGDPVRFAEVLVVATPCPLLIGAPVSFMGGMSSAARANVIIKDGGTLERLARIRSAAFDKTGTLTQGKPTVAKIHAYTGSAAEVLTVAASAEQYSVHAFATPIVEYARAQHVQFTSITDAEEIATNGVLATTSTGEALRVGKAGFIAEAVGAFDPLELHGGQAVVYVSSNDTLLGAIILQDPIRSEVRSTVDWLSDHGVDQMVMVTGDMAETALATAQEIGFVPEQVHASMSPTDKVRIVTALPGPTMMVGDGINDAPILASADVGIAMGGRGATAASESADAVVTSENFARIADVTYIAQRTVSIALQSIWFGMAVSLGLMAIAAAGFLPATLGALMQEVVDIVAIVIALRALRIHRSLPSEQ